MIVAGITGIASGFLARQSKVADIVRVRLAVTRKSHRSLSLLELQLITKTKR